MSTGSRLVITTQIRTQTDATMHDNMKGSEQKGFVIKENTKKGCY